MLKKFIKKLYINWNIVWSFHIKEETFKKIYDEYQKDLRKMFPSFAHLDWYMCNTETWKGWCIKDFNKIKSNEIIKIIQDIHRFYS